MANLVDLARKLHEERLFIKHEQDTIWKLNEQVQQHAERLSHSFWITRQHYLNLNKLIVNSAQGTPIVCSRRSHQLDCIQFIDAYKELGYQESMYSQFIEAFTNNPTMAAACLAYGDKLGLDSTAEVAHIIVLGCYGNSIMTDDHKNLLELMETLMLLQLAIEDQPRRLIQKGSCAFSVVFKLFTESLLIGKLFLTSALYQPVMEVLMDDELYLETNEQKILMQLSPFEIEQRFGRQDSPGFQEKIKAHIRNAEKRLSKICLSFINSLLAAMCCFPKSLGWIIARAFHIVSEAGLVSMNEARALCADFFLQQFVCPAIVNPELYGVTGDIPVGELTRSNLMQIAQVLQVMAHADETLQQSDNVYSRIDKDSMHCLIGAVINSCTSDAVPTASTVAHGYVNSALFFTPIQLGQLIQFLRDIQDSEVRGVDQSTLSTILSHLPSQPPSCMERAAYLLSTNSGAITPAEDEVASRNGSGGSDRLLPSGGSSGDLANSVQSSPINGKKMFSKSIKVKKTMRREESVESGMDESASGDNPTLRQSSLQELNETVLVISISSLAGSSQELIGTLSEHEVMELQTTQNIANSAANMVVENGSIDAGSINETEGMDKRSRFSLYSEGSDLSEIDQELPTEDGISGSSGSSSIGIDPTENVQADDTSSFHAASSHAGNQDEEDEEEGEDQESVTHANNDEALKALRRKLPSSRESIEDKMRKFEIRQELGVRFADPGVTGGPRRDETCPTGSTMPIDARSDTWSIDVYASDSEPPPEQDLPSERLRDIAEDPAQHMRNAPPNLSSFLTLARDEDSRSDVWSVEVLPSDSEPTDIQSEDRLQELDSESGNAPNADALEDNRSRASTPGLSAASGFSGVSGLSLVSDNNPPKAGDEQWINSERSFGKDPNSASPDAEDLFQLARGDSGSGGSSHVGEASSSGSDMNDRGANHSSNVSPRPQVASRSPVTMTTMKTRSEVVESVKVSVSFDDTVKKSENNQRIHPGGMEKTVVWDIPSSQEESESQEASNESCLGVTGFSDHNNTIKRSPYKKQKDDVKPNHVTYPSQTDCLSAWEENQEPVSLTAPGLSSVDTSTSFAVDHNPSSPFVLVSPSSQSSSILKDFDPLHEIPAQKVTAENSSSPANGSVPTEATRQPNNPFNIAELTESLKTPNKSGNAAGNDVSIEAISHATKGQEAISHATTGQINGVEEKEATLPDARKTAQPDSPGSNRKGLDRKKSWWKNNRLSTFARRKVAGKLNGPVNYDSSSAGNSPRHSAILETSSPIPDDSINPTKSTASVEMTSPEDIMQKYMKKVTNHPLNDRSGKEDRASPSAKNTSANPSTSNSPINDKEINTPTTSGVLLPLVDVSITTTVSSSASTSAPYMATWGGDSSDPPAIVVSTLCSSKNVNEMNKSRTNLKEDAKRKLRIVLSMSEPLLDPSTTAYPLTGISLNRSNLQYSSANDHSQSMNGGERAKPRDQLLSFLRVQHAEALTLQNHSRIAQIHEVTRCVEVLDDSGCRHVIKNLWKDYKSRSSYIAYLVRSRQHLLASASYLRHVAECTERDKSTCRRYFTAQCVRMFLKSKEQSINIFRTRFVKSIALDDKVSLVDAYLSWLYGQMVENQIWEGASEEQLQEGERFIERFVFTCVHKLAMFPNGDGDVLRDQLFQDHISRLSAVITPAHPSLLISRKYLQECPWPSAQREASALAAHRSPRGKLEAALRCCHAVMHLLKLADENQAPGADDFTPVLVFVLIKANPPHLLSTVQFVNSFLGERLNGEEAYWWLQFTAATEFIKTIDERQ